MLGRLLMEIRSEFAAAQAFDDGRLDSASDGDNTDDPDKTELYQVQTDQFTGDTTSETALTKATADQADRVVDKDSKERVDTSTVSEEVEPLPSLELFIPQRTSTPTPTTTFSHTSLAEPIPGSSFASDQTDFSADLPAD